MNVRHFTRGSGDWIKTNLGNTPSFGPATCAALVKKSSDTTNYEIIILASDNADPDNWIFYIGLGGDNKLGLFNGFVDLESPFTVLASEGWVMVAVTKATGTVAPRFHKYVLNTGVWTHQDCASTGANSGTMFTANTIGASNAHDATVGVFDGHILAVGVWNVVLNDAALEAISPAIYTNFDALIAGWLATATAPRVLNRLDQASVSTSITDDTGGGSGQNSRNGTTVVTNDDPTFGSGTAFTLPSPMFQSRRPMPMMRGPDLDRPRYRSYQGRAVSTGMPRFDAQSTLDFTSTNSWTHTPVTATPCGVVVMIAQNVVSTDLITGVTYGGVAMTRIATDGFAQDTVGEPGAAYVYFLGSNVPTGAQSVAVTVSSGTDAKTGWAVTLSGDADQAIAASGKIQVDTLNPSVTLATDGYFDGVCLSVFFSGLNAPTDGTITAGTGYTKLTASAAGGRDFGTESASAQYASGLKGANIACGWTAASDDVAMIALAVKRSP